MSTFWFLVIFYAILSVSIVLLTIRLVRRRREAREAAAEPSSAKAAASDEESDAAPAEPAPQEHRAPAEPPRPHQRWFLSPKSHSESVNQLPQIESDEIPQVGTHDYVFGPVTPALAALMPESESRRQVLKHELRAAGYYQPHALQNFLAVRYLAIIAPMIFCGMLLLVVPPRAEIAVLLMLVGLPLAGWAIPRLYLKSRASERISEISRAMPDMLDMLNMCASQGLTVGESLRRISGHLRAAYPALARELSIVCRQAGVGSLRQALENFSRRVDVPEVHSFASLLIQTERMGTSISAALTEYSDNIRESLRQRADAKANRSTFRLLFPTVLCLMPAVYLFLMGPALIELSEFFNQGGLDALRQEAARAQDVIQ